VAGATREVGIAAAYLSWLADSERKSFTISRGRPPSATGTSSPARAVLRGIRRTIGSARQGKAAATAAR
jgi:hypothetical protein